LAIEGRKTIDAMPIPLLFLKNIFLLFVLIFFSSFLFLLLVHIPPPNP